MELEEAKEGKERKASNWASVRQNSSSFIKFPQNLDRELGDSLVFKNVLTSFIKPKIKLAEQICSRSNPFSKKFFKDGKTLGAMSNVRMIWLARCFYVWFLNWIKSWKNYSFSSLNPLASCGKNGDPTNSEPHHILENLSYSVIPRWSEMTYFVFLMETVGFMDSVQTRGGYGFLKRNRWNSAEVELKGIEMNSAKRNSKRRTGMAIGPPL